MKVLASVMVAKPVLAPPFGSVAPVPLVALMVGGVAAGSLETVILTVADVVGRPLLSVAMASSWYVPTDA